MKTNIGMKLIILAIVTTIFIITGCATGGSGAGRSSTSQKEITITDLSDFEGRYAIVTFSPDTKKGAIAYCVPTLVRNGTASLDMLDPQNKPFTKNGDYLIILMITKSVSDEDLDKPEWSGFIVNKRIEGKETTISFTKFLDTSIFGEI